MLKDFGLIPAVKYLVSQINDQKNINIEFNSFNYKSRIDKKMEKALYRIVQEALNNIVKHSNANNANIQIVRHPKSVIMIIDDNGVGFDPENYRGSTGK